MQPVPWSNAVVLSASMFALAGMVWALMWGIVAIVRILADDSQKRHTTLIELARSADQAEQPGNAHNPSHDPGATP